MYKVGFTLFSLLSFGCAAGQINVVSKGVFAEKPANVAAYMAVSEDDAALEGLSADNFRIYEDDQYIPPENSRQVLLDKELAHAHRTIILVDQSSATDETIRKEIADGLGFFVDRVRTTQPVTIYAFDGRKDLRLIAELPQQAALPPKKGSGAKASESFASKLKPADTSRNLNGAIIDGLKALDTEYAKISAPLRAGTLIIFSGGPDIAGRVNEKTVREAIDTSRYNIIAVGLGDSAPLLRDYGRDGFVDGHNAQMLSMALEEAGYLVEDDYKRHYLLAYCSPARAGERTLRVEVVREVEPSKADAASDGETAQPQLAVGSSGQMGTFYAIGFAEGCDPMKTPHFKAAR